MAKITGLSQLLPADVSPTDQLPIVDVSDQTQSINGTTKRILQGDLFWQPFTTSKFIGVGGRTGTIDGSGIAFPTTADPSTDPNMLDDYEEGTWTPTYVGTTTAGTATYTNREGDYTRIGNICWVSVWINWTSGTGTGNARITGLPFTSDPVNYSALAVGWSINYSGASGTILRNYVNANTTNIDLYRENVGGGAAGLYPYDAAANILFTGTYLIG